MNYSLVTFSQIMLINYFLKQTDVMVEERCCLSSGFRWNKISISLFIIYKNKLSWGFSRGFEYHGAFSKVKMNCLICTSCFKIIYILIFLCDLRKYCNNIRNKIL